MIEIKQEVERELREDLTGLRPEEAVVLAFLQQRLDVGSGALAKAA